MIRKSLFWGLTLMLTVALVALIVRGRRLEKDNPGGPVEIVRESLPTATRVLAPTDLEILRTKMTMDRGAGEAEETGVAHHAIEIENRGKVAYEGIQLGFAYLDRNGKVLVIKTYFAAESLQPGNTLNLQDVRIADVPISAVDYRLTIVFADIARTPDSR